MSHLPPAQPERRNASAPVQHRQTNTQQEGHAPDHPNLPTQQLQHAQKVGGHAVPSGGSQPPARPGPNQGLHLQRTGATRVQEAGEETQTEVPPGEHTGRESYSGHSVLRRSRALPPRRQQELRPPRQRPALRNPKRGEQKRRPQQGDEREHPQQAGRRRKLRAKHGDLHLPVLQSHVQVAVLLPEARAPPPQSRQSGGEGGAQGAGGEARGQTVGYERAVLSVQDVRLEVSQLLFRAQAQEAVPSGGDGRQQQQEQRDRARGQRDRGGEQWKCHRRGRHPRRGRRLNCFLAVSYWI